MSTLKTGCSIARRALTKKVASWEKHSTYPVADLEAVHEVIKMLADIEAGEEEHGEGSDES